MFVGYDVCVVSVCRAVSAIINGAWQMAMVIMHGNETNRNAEI